MRVRLLSSLHASLGPAEGPSLAASWLQCEATVPCRPPPTPTSLAWPSVLWKVENSGNSRNLLVMGAHFISLRLCGRQGVRGRRCERDGVTLRGQQSKGSDCRGGLVFRAHCHHTAHRHQWWGALVAGTESPEWHLLPTSSSGCACCDIAPCGLEVPLNQISPDDHGQRNEGRAVRAESVLRVTPGLCLLCWARHIL